MPAQDRKQESFTLTAPVIMGSEHVVEAFAYPIRGKVNEKGEPQYDAMFGFEPAADDLTALKMVIAKLYGQKWPGRDMNGLARPIQNGTSLAEKGAAKAKADQKANNPQEWMRGLVVLKCKSKYRPQLGVVNGRSIIDLDEDAKVAIHKGKFYAGVNALAKFTLFTYEGVGANPDGVSAQLDAVISLGTGKRLFSRASASEVFKGYQGSVTADDPRGPQGDEIPF